MQAKKRVTLKDVAEVLGVHFTTVSLAMRNSSLLKDETKSRIQEKAKQMGYLPDKLAQGLRRKRSHSIGIMVPNIHHHFFSEFISEITDFASHYGYSIIILQSNEKLENEKINVKSLIENRVAGVIVSISRETLNSEHFRLFDREGIPVVFFDRVPDDYHGPEVVINNYQLACDAVEMMIKKGRKRIAYISLTSHINVFRERLRGYKDTMKKNHFAFSKYLLFIDEPEIINGAKAAKKLMSDKIKPDGILAVNDRVALGVIKYLKKIGCRIPEEISVVGFDNDPVGLAVEPELSTCGQSIIRLARISLDLLLDLIENKKVISQKFLINGNIISRNSS